MAFLLYPEDDLFTVYDIYGFCSTAGLQTSLHLTLNILNRSFDWTCTQTKQVSL